MVDSVHEARVAAVLAAAKEQAVGSGESDLRRLRRQFSSLKNTFCLYDTKENFIDGARPNCSKDTQAHSLGESPSFARAGWQTLRVGARYFADSTA